MPSSPPTRPAHSTFPPTSSPYRLHLSLPPPPATFPIQTIISHHRRSATGSSSRTAAVNHNNLIQVPRQTLLAPALISKPVNFGLLNIRSLNNKSFLCHDFITFNNLDFFIITETWLSEGDCSPLIEATPPDFTHLHQPRLSGRGGGVAVIYRNDFKCTRILFNNFTSFEHLGFMVHSKEPIIILIIYRPPKSNNIFIQEFAELLSHFLSKYHKILILGDFNIHICCPSQMFVTDFMDTLESFNLTQAIQEPTHSKGHILDLVLYSGLSPDNFEIKDICVSDHKMVLFNVLLTQVPFNHSTPFRRRVFNSMSASKFSELFTTASLTAFNPHFNTEELVSLFNHTCQSVLDSVAPYKDKKSKRVPQPWLNESTNELKRDCRRKERKWKKTGLHVFYQIWKDAMTSYQKAVKEAKRSFFSSLILANHSNPRILFKTIDSVTTPSPCHFIDASQETCEKF